MDQLGYVSAMVEIEFYGEVGTGLGPTLEFYSMLALELQSASLNMWRCPATVTRAELFPDGTKWHLSITQLLHRMTLFVRSRSSTRLWQRAGWRC